MRAVEAFMAIAVSWAGQLGGGGAADPSSALPSDEPDAGGAEWAAIRRRLEQDRVKMRFLRKEETSIAKGVRALDKELAEKRRATRDLAKEVGRLESRIAEVDVELGKREAELRELRERAVLRVRAMHRLRRTRISELFEHVVSASELRRLRDRLSAVLAYDAKLTSSARWANESALQLRDELGVKKGQLTERASRLESDLEEIAELRQERAALFEAIRHERSASERLASELLLQAKKVEREAGIIRGVGPRGDAAPGGFEAQAGRLPWPVSGRLEAPFGKKVDPESGMIMIQKGIDIRAPLGSAVRAVFPGRVVYGAWLDGYGRLVILEHQGGFFSLYAHLESIDVASGAIVNPHQVIGLVGDSGSSKGAYLYFELRRGREAMDPMRWLGP